MAEYIIEIGEHELHVNYTYIPAQQEKYPDTMPISSYVEIDKIYIYCVNDTVYTSVDITDIMLECADDWLINLESEIIEKLEG